MLRGLMRGRVLLTMAALGLAITVTAGELKRPASAQMMAADVFMGEYAYAPADLAVPAGTVTFNLSNGDSLRHNMVIGVNGTLLESETYDGGQGGTWDVALDQPGFYNFWCSITNHRERGMVGTLTVE